MLDDFDLEDIPEEGPPPEESNNRTFLLLAGGLGGLALLAIICLAVIYFYNSRTAQTDFEATQAAIDAKNTETVRIAALTEEAAAFTLTPTNTLPPTLTDTPTETEEAGVTVTLEGGPTSDPRTATVQALLTQASLAQTQAASAVLTVTVTPTLVLPDTGFADDVGIVGLLALSSMLVVVIFLVRRIRVANS